MQISYNHSIIYELDIRNRKPMQTASKSQPYSHKLT